MKDDDVEKCPRCPHCNGTGIDPAAHKRYTTGGNDNRDCPVCNGDCHIVIETDTPPKQKL